MAPSFHFSLRNSLKAAAPSLRMLPIISDESIFPNINKCQQTDYREISDTACVQDNEGSC